MASLELDRLFCFPQPKSFWEGDACFGFYDVRGKMYFNVRTGNRIAISHARCTFTGHIRKHAERNDLLNKCNVRYERTFGMLFIYFSTIFIFQRNIMLKAIIIYPQMR